MDETIIIYAGLGLLFANSVITVLVMKRISKVEIIIKRLVMGELKPEGKKCGTCVGFGLWPVGKKKTPIAETAVQKVGSLKCPECGEGGL